MIHAAFDLKDRTVLLTGASKGIGAATRALGASGAALVAHYATDRDGALDSTSDIPANRKLLGPTDLAVPGEADRLWASAVGWRGRVHVLVNNAAVIKYGSLDDSAELSASTWERALAVNVRAVADLTRCAVRHFSENGGGVVITLSSWVAQRGPGSSGLMAYAASKAAARNLTQSVVRHYAKQGVLAYVVAPGVVRTRLSQISAEKAGGEAKVTRNFSMREWIPPEELGSLIMFLASGHCRHLTGASLDVNGASYIR